MAAVLQPRDERDIVDAVAQAAASGEALEIIGGGTKRGIGFPDRQTRQLSTTNLSRVIDYDPAELVLTVEPGARLADIEALLAQNSQMLAFDPWDFAETTGGAPGRSTIGGVIGAGLAGPRRISAGGVRDHVLGFHAVNGRGEAFKAGGRVVKNVTGYDLSKLMAGSWGQLAVLTQVTLKVLPRAPDSRTLAISGVDAQTAVHAMALAMNCAAEVSAAAYCASFTMIRLEGFGPSMNARADILKNALQEFDLSGLTPADADTRWRAVRNASALGPAAGRSLWRIVVPPSNGAAILVALGQLDGESVLDWGGGLIWSRTLADISIAEVRKIAETSNGHAMLIDAPDAIRRAVSALHPQQPAIAALSRRVRDAFDPNRIFDPHRFEPLA